MLKFCKSLLATTLVLVPSAAFAHPHEFVTMAITAKFNKNGAVKALQYNWTFDEFFSAYAVEGQDANKNGKPEPEELNALLGEILGNIKPINYFTKFENKYPAPKFGAAIAQKAAMKNRQLSITFEVPFTKPYSLKKNPLVYAIYDDEFYIAMTHESEDKALTLQDAPAGCSWKLEEPAPDESVQEFANSLGKNDSGGNQLGLSFAEWAVISCK